MKVLKSKIPYGVLFIFILITSACSSTKTLKDNEHLLTKQKIKIESPAKGKKTNELSYNVKALARPEPNSMFLFAFPASLWFYNEKDTADRTKFGNWIQRNLAEVPVLADSVEISDNNVLMKNYLFNKGYFNSTSKFTLQHRQKKASVLYDINTGPVSKIDNIYYPSEVNEVNDVIHANVAQSLLEIGDNFDFYVLDNERERIAQDLRNNGFYGFSKEYIYFETDSTDGAKNLDLYLRIQQNVDSLPHQKYYINDVYVHPDFALNTVSQTKDTVEVESNLYFIDSAYEFKHETLARDILMRKEDLYSQEDYRLSLNRLNSLGVFKFSNADFIPSINDSTLLDVVFYLTRAPKRVTSLDVEFDYDEANQLGSTVRLSHKNKNQYRGAELTEFNIEGGVETSGKTDNPTTQFFNSLEVTGSAGITFPRFLVPFKLENVSKRFRPTTKAQVELSYFLRRDLFSRNSIDLTFGYDWQVNQERRHLLTPFSINFITLNPTDTFQVLLDENPRLRSSYEQRFILGIDYSYIYNEQKEGKRSYNYFRGDLSLAGNAIQTINAIAGSTKNAEGQYEIFSNPYAQFAKAELEFRNYRLFSGNSQFVTRFIAGAGVPYGNSEVLPYVKQFIIGGTNSLRGWTVRTLGPGSDTTNIGTILLDQTGDVKLEANAEYRFDMFSRLKGALFIDAGNIWTIRDDPNRMNEEFQFGRFANEIALDAGVGFRLDFTYFIFRFDVGIPLRDPSLPDGQRWIADDIKLGDKNWRQENLLLNLAIGYPF